MLPCCGKRVQSCGVRGASALFGVQLISGAAEEFSFMTP
jgi:hypothetical protein